MAKKSSTTKPEIPDETFREGLEEMLARAGFYLENWRKAAKKNVSDTS